MSIDYAARRARLAPALGLSADEILLVAAGHQQPKPELSDALLPFIAHQEYYYLTGHAEARGGILAYDAAKNEWTSFVSEVTEMERVWDGAEQLPGEFLGRFDAWLAVRRGRRIAMLGAPIAGVAADEALTARVRDALRHARRPKEPGEIALMKRCALATAEGYAAVQPFLRAGVSERRMQIELEAGFFRGGADKTGYDTIVGVGKQAAVFHGSPSTQRVAREGDFILIDAGGERERYVIDVTRTYVAGGKPSAFQRDLYAAVKNAHARACARCVPGAEWKDIHFGAAIDMIGSLVDMGVMRGNASSLVEQEAHMLFYPHGVGHMLGLGVRDGSGLEPGRVKDPRPCLKSLRMDLILRPGYIVTIEPGLYFIPALLNDPARRAKYRDCLNWSLAEQHLGLGGVRIEDNMLVTAGAPENLTAMVPQAF
ncbi:MAG: aminopeptidase P N-terminal domain-containing protein [Opitutae bacterium]|nr:aminopeptidase P N-terminal domain-containing protein [Opitutae bacterium]